MFFSLLIGEILCVTGESGSGITSVVASFTLNYIDLMQKIAKQRVLAH